jgi:bis(5'-nucleosyl)-tetraphosphatase (symmetrical)
MARYAIGDIQGCYAEFVALLNSMAFNPANDQLFLVGDLVNRGPLSLDTLRWAAQNDCVMTVLGNHDLHLLALYAGVSQLKPGDTVNDILTAPDVEPLMDWLRHQPLLIDLGDTLIAHAGVCPSWSLETAKAASAEVEAVLRGDDWKAFLSIMYGNQPARWDMCQTLDERLRFTVNAFTRMRFVTDDGSLQLKYKGEREQAPAGISPWFDATFRQLLPRRIVCGHWSALGLMLKSQVWALDTGCVWGGALTGVDLDSGQVFQAAARSEYQALLD